MLPLPVWRVGVGYWLLQFSPDADKAYKPSAQEKQGAGEGNHITGIVGKWIVNFGTLMSKKMNNYNLFNKLIGYYG